MRATSDARTWISAGPGPAVGSRQVRKGDRRRAVPQPLGRHGAGLPQGCDRGGQHRQAGSEIARVSAVARPWSASRLARNRSRPPAYVHLGIRPNGARQPGRRHPPLGATPDPGASEPQYANVRRRPRGVRARRGSLTEQCLICAGRPGLARRVFVRRVPLRRGHPVQSRRLRRSVPRIPSLAQLRQCQAGGELPAASC